MHEPRPTAISRAPSRRDLLSRPRDLVIGIGCQRATPAALLSRGVLHVLRQRGLSLSSVGALASIAQKSGEAGLLALAIERGWPISFYSQGQLARVSGLPTPSARVREHVGVRGVAEAAALLHAGTTALIVPRVVYREPRASHSVTLAVARARSPRREGG